MELNDVLQIHLHLLIVMKEDKSLFELVYELPLQNEQIKNYYELQLKVQEINSALLKLTKSNPDEIEKVCKTNQKLHHVARLLREHTLPAEAGNYSSFMSKLIIMFTLMLTSSKMVEFFNKLCIPFSIYRILVRSSYNRNKIDFLKKAQAQQALKFVGRLITVTGKKFPRLFANLIFNIIRDYTTARATEKEKDRQDLLVQQRIKESQKLIESHNNIITIAIQLMKCSLKLAAESGVLCILYRKAVEGDLSIPASTQLIETIVTEMNTAANRDIILSHVDLGKAFALFTNVDSRLKEGKTEERLQKCANIIQILLSSTSTLVYFICEKVTLKNFILSLRSKNKNEREIVIINKCIFSKIIQNALKYDRDKMERSKNRFGLFSNYLNIKPLIIFSYFLDNTDLFEIYMKMDPSGEIFRVMGKLSLQYFPMTFEKEKYNRAIIQTMRLPTSQNYQNLAQNYLDILSYTNDCILPYEYTPHEFIGYLLDLKNLECYDTISNEDKQKIQILLNKIKRSDLSDLDDIACSFYQIAIDIMKLVEWRPEYLHICKFLSMNIEVRSNSKPEIAEQCLSVMETIFKNPAPNYYRHLDITILDDVGRYFGDMERVQQLILQHYQLYEYSFRISRILLQMDFEKKQGFGNYSQKKLLEKICCEGGSEELILQVIEIIKYYCIENDEKAGWGTQIVTSKLIYHSSEEIVCASVEFCEEVTANHRHHYHYLEKINLSAIKDVNLRKRIMYLLLNSEKGIEILNSNSPNFIHNEAELWFKEGPNLLKQLSVFLTKQSKRFAANKQFPFIDVGAENSKRHQLISLPWNIRINDDYYVALASYKHLKEKIKLRVYPEIVVDGSLEISSFFIGSVPVFPNEQKTSIIVRKQQILKNYEKNKDKEAREIKRFAVSKQKITLFMKYDMGCLILSRITSSILLSKDVYLPISYPLNFLVQLTKTQKGVGYIRDLKLMSQCLQFCKEQKDIELTKGALSALGLFLLSNKLDSQEKLQIFEAVHRVYEETTSFELSETALWSLNIIVKDEDYRKKLKQSKGWLILESKYCGWICYPYFYRKIELINTKIRQFSHIPSLLPEKLNDEGYRLIIGFLETSDRTEKEMNNQRVKKKQMFEHFKKPENREYSWNPKLFERVFQYLAVVDYGIDKIREVIQIFTEYYLSDKFDADFVSGFIIS